MLISRLLEHNERVRMMPSDMTLTGLNRNLVLFYML